MLPGYFFIFWPKNTLSCSKIWPRDHWEWLPNFSRGSFTSESCHGMPPHTQSLTSEKDTENIKARERKVLQRKEQPSNILNLVCGAEAEAEEDSTLLTQTPLVIILLKAHRAGVLMMMSGIVKKKRGHRDTLGPWWPFYCIQLPFCLLTRWGGGPSLKGDEAPCEWKATLTDLLATDAVAAHTVANGSNFNFGRTVPLLWGCCLSLNTTSLPLLTQRRLAWAPTPCKPVCRISLWCDGWMPAALQESFWTFASLQNNNATI